MKRALLAVIFSCLISTSAWAATYYVRNDGGTNTQCTGFTDAAYSGTGTGQACAFNSPFWANAQAGTSPSPFAGGDTLIIDGANHGFITNSGNAEYMMGWGAPNTPLCSTSWPWDCYMRAIPSGPDAAHPTRILGKGWDTGCANAPQLWANERPWVLISLASSNNVELQCLELTDHSQCVTSHGEIPCKRDVYPFGPWGNTGISAADSNNVLLKNVNIHGFANTGIQAGRLSNWILDTVNIAGNGWVGWNGDIGAGISSNSGNMTFAKVKVEWNGCGETYPNKSPIGCWSQDQGGYGDGLGTQHTSGHWSFDGCSFSHNTSDGLDLLYCDDTCQIDIYNSRFEGNAGNQVKTTGAVTMANSKVIGDCDFFHGQPFTATHGTSGALVGFNDCRAFGNAFSTNPQNGNKVTITNSTLSGTGDCIISTGGSNCLGTEQVSIDSSVIYPFNDFMEGDKTCLFWAGGSDGNGAGSCGLLKATPSNTDIYNVKEGTAINGTNLKFVDPQFIGPVSGADWGVSLSTTSPVIGWGYTATATPTPPPVVEVCGNGSCANGETCSTCPTDCGVCPPAPSCGDGVCNGTETCSTCPVDCGVCPPVASWTLCANEGSQCAFTGTYQVRYGANNIYNYGTFTNGVSCSNAAFGGDPVPYVVKHCDYGSSAPTTSCGDGICNGVETCSTCSGDCGACCTLVNGGWSAWAACSGGACGGSGTQTRTCTNPAPSCGGATCVGAASQTCPMPACAPSSVTVSWSTLSRGNNISTYSNWINAGNLFYFTYNGKAYQVVLVGAQAWSVTWDTFSKGSNVSYYTSMVDSGKTVYYTYNGKTYQVKR